MILPLSHSHVNHPLFFSWNPFASDTHPFMLWSELYLCVVHVCLSVHHQRFYLLFSLAEFVVLDRWTVFYHQFRLYVCQCVRMWCRVWHGHYFVKWGGHVRLSTELAAYRCSP
jgi:hypothetical protein